MNIIKPIGTDTTVVLSTSTAVSHTVKPNTTYLLSASEAIIINVGIGNSFFYSEANRPVYISTGNSTRVDFNVVAVAGTAHITEVEILTARPGTYNSNDGTVS